MNRSIWTWILGLALLAESAAAQIEGPLDNDSYLPTSPAAEAELARGDQAFALALRIGDAGDERATHDAWTTTCEAWRNALVKSQSGESASPRPIEKPGDVSPWPTAEDGVERSTEGVEEAVFRRLAAAPKAARLVWRERFSALADEELSSAAAVLATVARIERELPATAAASKAALLLAELSFESGDVDAARRWLARARRHLAATGIEDAPIHSGIALREGLLPKLPEASEATWQHAVSLELVAGRALEIPRNQPVRTRPLGTGPQAGMAFLSQDRALIQTPAALWILAGAELAASGPFENNRWLGPAGLSVEPTVAPGNGPGWRLDPAASGSSAVVVVGRSLGGRPNVLACVDFGESSAEPHLRWAQAAAAVSPGDMAESSDEFEFEPGPLWSDGLVIALVRRASSTSGEHEIELRALEPATGALRWRSYLGKGGERVRDMGRFARRGVATMPAEPLIATASGILASAQLGFCGLVDPLDGRCLFALRNHRRAADERGWTGWGSSVADSNALIGWAPADSDYLYLLDARGAGSRGTPWLALPQALGEAEALVHADKLQVLALARSGARAALARWDLASGERQDALRLGPEEVFSGRALASDQRVIAASDRALYLFDRSKDLGLLAAPTLAGPIPRGGNLWAKGARVYVLSSRFVEVFSAR
ncbi:MAG TPA: hypothetical protein VK843_01355 [Planctomycetota bacterium]|nr:hypothetical protein [Planctomycetota bacterium]